VITVVPPATPVTTPVVDPMVAMPVRLLIHVPPDVGSFNVVVLPTHNVVVPPIAAGTGFTVIVFVAWQPVEVMMSVIVAVPAATPVTTPEDASIVATEVLLLLQEAPDIVDVSVIVEPAHTTDGPVIDGNASIVTE